MHQIAFGGRAPPGPKPSSWIKGSLLLREEDEKGSGREGMGKGGSGRQGGVELRPPFHGS